MDIMPKDISRWSITNGTITEKAIYLNKNGVASVNIEHRDIVSLPTSATLQLTTSIFSDGYNPNIFVDVYIDSTFHQRINCVDNRGLVHIEIELPGGPYSNFKIEIHTDTEVTISNISLVVPTPPLEELLSDIREELPRILSYENRHKFSIDQIENPIGVISLRLLESASVNGHLQINFIALEDCTVFIRFYTDEVVELYAPSTYSVKQGWNSIGIPHAYLYKTAGIHTMYVTAQVSNGSIIFEPNGVLYTIDGGRLASRIIEVGFDVRDITMRRTDPYSDPTYVFAAGIDNGHALVRGREYSQEYAIPWEPIGDLGPAKDIRIESDGAWVQTVDGYKFVTFEYPSATVLRLNGDLEFIDLNNVIPTSIIASNVTNHSMVRGYNNISFSDRDQGMLIAYVKESKAYYRNIVTLNGETTIQPEMRLLDTVDNVIRVVAVRLNDYRLAIVVEAEDTNYLMVTERYWEGMASPAEHLVAGVSDVTFEVTPITYSDLYSDDEHIESSVAIERFYVCPADVTPEIIGTERLSFSDKKTIQIMFNYELECELDNLKKSLVLKNIANQSFTIDTVEEAGNVLTIKTVEEMPFSQDIILTYDRAGSYYLAFRISDTCLYDYGKSINLTIEGAPPTGFTSEYLEGTVTDISFVVTQVYYSSIHSGGENLAGTVTDVSFVVTKIGDIPL